MTHDTIRSLKELQLLMPAIIKEHGHNNALTQIALANPIIALERAGFSFTEEAKKEIERYVRFGHQELQKLTSLEQKLYDQLGQKVDLQNPAAIAEAMTAQVNQSSPDSAQGKLQSKKKTSSAFNSQEFVTKWNTPPTRLDGKWRDELHQYADLHPVMRHLIEYRTMQAEHSPFASPQQLAMIEKKLPAWPLKNIVFSMSRKNS